VRTTILCLCIIAVASLCCVASAATLWEEQFDQAYDPLGAWTDANAWTYGTGGPTSITNEVVDGRSCWRLYDIGDPGWARNTGIRTAISTDVGDYDYSVVVDFKFAAPSAPYPMVFWLYDLRGVYVESLMNGDSSTMADYPIARSFATLVSGGAYTAIPSYDPDEWYTYEYLNYGDSETCTLRLLDSNRQVLNQSTWSFFPTSGFTLMPVYATISMQSAGPTELLLDRYGVYTGIVPEPGAFASLAVGLFGFGALIRRRK